MACAKSGQTKRTKCTRQNGRNSDPVSLHVFEFSYFHIETGSECFAQKQVMWLECLLDWITNEFFLLVKYFGSSHIFPKPKNKTKSVGITPKCAPTPTSLLRQLASYWLARGFAQQLIAAKAGNHAATVPLFCVLNSLSLSFFLSQLSSHLMYIGLLSF